MRQGKMGCLAPAVRRASQCARVCRLPGLSGGFREAMTEEKPWLRGLGSSHGPATAGGARYLRGGSFPSLGLRFHICTMGMVAMMIFIYFF